MKKKKKKQVAKTQQKSLKLQNLTYEVLPISKT